MMHLQSSTNFQPNLRTKQFGLWFICMFLVGRFTMIYADETFAPNEGGSLPTFTEFQPVEGMVGGFLVTSSVRHNDWFGTGTHAEVNMSFPDAATYGTETLVLQYKNGDSGWSSLLNNENEITTSGTNFSLELNQSYTLRLLLRGGVKNGFVSNEQEATLSLVDTYFSNYSLDESMYLTGVMAPWVGRGLKASYIVNKTSDNSVVESGLTYQWYRVNPVTYERTLIPGADSLTYTTTSADAGYRMSIVATGDQATVGGFYQVVSGWDVVNPNKSYVSNQTSAGFNLVLYMDVATLDTGDLVLRDKDWEVVPITGVSKSKTNGLFYIAAPLSLEKNPYRLENKSSFWSICTEMVFGPMHDLMEGVSIDLTLNAVKDISNEAALNMRYVTSSRQIQFTASSLVKEVSMFNLAGSLLTNWKVGQFEGRVPVGNIAPGVYVLRFMTDKGSLARKVVVER